MFNVSFRTVFPDKGSFHAEFEQSETFNIEFGTGSGILQDKEVTPTKEEQVITADKGAYGLRTVTVYPIPDEYQDVSMVTTTAEDVKSPAVFVDSEGNVISGTMPDNGPADWSINGLEAMSCEVPMGFTDGGYVTITDDIALALAAL